MLAGTSVDVAAARAGVVERETGVEVETTAGVGVTGGPGVIVGKSGTGLGLVIDSVASTWTSAGVAVLKDTTSDNPTVSASAVLLLAESTKRIVATRYPAQLKMTNTAAASKPKKIQRPGFCKSVHSRILTGSIFNLWAPEQVR